MIWAGLLKPGKRTVRSFEERLRNLDECAQVPEKRGHSMVAEDTKADDKVQNYRSECKTWDC